MQAQDINQKTSLIRQIREPREIVTKIKNLAATERRITADILECIRDIEKQKVFLEMGYPSLLEFLVKECGYSETAALRRISSAKILQELPEIKADLQNGVLNLSQVAGVAQGIRQAAKKGDDVSLEKKKEVLQALKGKRSFESQVITAKMLDLPTITTEKVRAQADASSRIEIILAKEEMDLVNQARQILGHITPGMSVKDLLIYLSGEVVRKKNPVRDVRTRAMKSSKPTTRETSGDKDNHQNKSANGAINPSKSSAQASASGKQIKFNSVAVLCGVKNDNKYIQASVRRFVFQRDKVCQWTDPITGRKCESTHLLEIDHCKPRWAGGGNEIENLRVLCRAHNQWRYKQALT